MRAVAVERRDDRVFHRRRAAQAAVRQLLDRAEHVVHPLAAADGEPSRSPSRREVRLRQRRERDHRRVGIELRDRVNRAVEGEIGVDLVGEQRDVVIVGDLQQLAPHGGRIGAAGRIVRIDDDQRARGRADQPSNLAGVRHPVRCRASCRRTPAGRRSWRARRYRADRSAPGPALRRPVRRARSAPARCLRTCPR